MRISASLIVRDEEATLGRCLQSIREHVDEIVVVDTGSRDATKEIARQYHARLFDYPWRDDFAAARQCSFDLARGDWVFWVDADDVVLQAGSIRAELLRAPRSVNCFYWKYEIGRDEFGYPTCELWRERCVRNRNYRWRGRVHEVLVPRRRGATRRSPNVRVLHHPEARPRPRDPRRNLDILESEYTRCRGRVEPRLLYYLANEYADTGQHDAAIAHLKRYLEVSRWNDEKYLALLRLAELNRSQWRFEEARCGAEAARQLIPGWPHAYFSLAETCYFMHDWEQVVRWAEAGAKLALPDTLCVLNTRSLRYSWIIYYTNALFHLGRLPEARDWTAKALEICPSEPWHVRNWQFFSECMRPAG
jgi:glycosyltransferase involved in cell wall biosynthesis